MINDSHYHEPQYYLQAVKDCQMPNARGGGRTHAKTANQAWLL